MAVRTQNLGIEEVSAGQFRRDRQSFLEDNARPLHVALLYCAAADVHPAIGIVRIRLGYSLKCRRGTLQVTLQEQSNSVIVPALPFFLANGSFGVGQVR